MCFSSQIVIASCRMKCNVNEMENVLRSLRFAVIFAVFQFQQVPTQALTLNKVYQSVTNNSLVRKIILNPNYIENKSFLDFVIVNVVEILNNNFDGPSNADFPYRQKRSTVKKEDDKKPTQFKITDIKVPIGFLRTEYMIGYTFMGAMYGLGFLVLYQSILVPLIKGLIGLLYVWSLFWGAIEPVTLQMAMQQVPPQ